MTTALFIDGAAGTTGLEIRDRLAGRTEFDLIVLPDADRKDEGARRQALHDADIAILCLPDDAARDAVALAQGGDTRIIDASSAHRVAEGWTYGFPEIIGHKRIAGAARVANPGCYPTGFIALVAPLVDEGMLHADFPYTVNAVSGYSGGGNALIDRFETDGDIAFRAYGLGLGHKHIPEMRKYAGIRHAPVFSPAVIPAHRGMIVDVPLPAQALAAPADAAAIHDCLQSAYDGSAIVRVHNPDDNPAELLLRTDEGGSEKGGSDAIDLFVFTDGSQARLVAMLDNLGKGASGAAIQNLNIMCGLPEASGLRL